MAGAERPGADGPDDGVARLRERLQSTQRAAERLIESVERGPGATRDDPSTSGASQAGRPPAAGFAVPDPGAAASSTLDEVTALLRLVAAVVPTELAQELGQLARELLLLLRALIDWLVGRLEQRRTEPVEVTDIPIG